jgi:transposase
MFVGLDVHKEFCQAAFVNAKGKLVREEAFKTDEKGLDNLVKATRRSKVVIEASTTSLHIYDILCDSCTVVVAHPLKVKAIASAKIKTDKIDARILAQLLRADLIPQAYYPSKEQRQIRSLVRHRISLREMTTRIKNQIHAILAKEGIKSPYKEVFGKRGTEFLRTVDVGELHRLSLNSLLIVMAELNKQIKESEDRIEEVASQNAYCKLLKTHPGVGWLTALAVASEVVDISRFPSHKHFCSYLGIVPSVYQSGSTDRKGHITRQGNSMIRWLLTQCARNASRHSRRFRRKYARFMKRGLGDQRAIIAIARTIAVDMYFMLVRSEPYKESKGGNPVSVADPMRPSQRLGSSPLHDFASCAASTNRSMS